MTAATYPVAGQRPAGGSGGRRRLVATFFVVLVLVGATGYATMSGIVDSVTRGSETAAIFNAAATVPSDLLDTVVWQPDDADMHRDMEPLTRLAVTDAWLRAWSQLLVVAETQEIEGLEVYFSNSALDAVTASSLDLADQPVQQLGHDLALHFYSEDGSVAGFESRSTRLLRRYRTSAGDAWFESDETYDVVMLLEDGNWRVQHWVRRSIDGRWLDEPPAEHRAAAGREIGWVPRVALLAVVFAAQVGFGWHRMRRTRGRRMRAVEAASPSFQ